MGNPPPVILSSAIEPSSKYTNMASSFRSILGASPSKASTDDSVLLIIDAQNEYASGKLAVRDVDASRAKIASLLEKYRAAGAPPRPRRPRHARGRPHLHAGYSAGRGVPGVDAAQWRVGCHQELSRVLHPDELARAAT